MARRIALVVGVSRYHAFSPLPTAARDAETIAHVLRQVAGFDEVRVLAEPDATQLAEASEYLFADKQPDDLVLLYFSGHGVKDERGHLHLAVPGTRKHASGELVRATAVSCRNIHDTMTASRSRRQVVILDCCFSGAFAEGIAPKDGGHVDLRGQLGGEGRVVLTSSASTQYSFDAGATGLSTYTQYIVHGIASGEADLNHDGLITVDELHEYARARVQATRPEMSPQILPTREGYSIVISAARKADPRRAYAAKVRELADASGVLSRVAGEVLALRRAQLGLQAPEAEAIEGAELAPLRGRASARATLRRAVYDARNHDRVARDRALLNELRVALDLGEQDLKDLLVEPLAVQRARVLGWRLWPQRVLIYGAAAAVVFTLGPFVVAWTRGDESTAAPTPTTDSPSNSPTDPAPKPTPRGPTPDEPAPREPIPVPSPSPTREPTDLPPAPADPAPGNPDITGAGYVLHLSSKYSLDKARYYASRVAARTLGGQLLRPQVVYRDGYYCVLVGPYDSRYEAERLLPIAKDLLGQGGYVQSMASWCPVLGPQSDGYRSCQQ